MSTYGFTDYLADQVNTRFRDRTDGERTKAGRPSKDAVVATGTRALTLFRERLRALQELYCDELAAGDSEPVRD